MTDIASLGIKIDTSDIGKAERDLDGLNQAGKDAEAAAKKVGSAWEAAAGKISGDTGEIVRQLQALNKTQTATVQSLAKLDQTVSKFGSEAARAAAGVKTAASAVDILAKSEKESASGVKVGTAAVQDQQQALSRLLGQIDPVVAAMARLDAQQDELQKFRNLGLIDGAAFDSNKAKLDAARASLANVNAQLKQTGVSSAQTSAALRMLPAQFTDIFTSLQAGQSPLQVFLQQGGQIKDSFGGIGPALRETGKYALGLVNPFTLAAVAVGALALAYKQGSDEQTAYNKAIILTGNYAGVSSAQLELMAQRLDKVGGTQRQAARTLAEFVSTGRFAASQLEGISAAAIAMENATGKAVSETVSEFVRLADSPVQAIAELNKAQRFLTAETYAAIVALDEQGRTAEAAELAIRAYSDTMQSRAGQVVERLGYIESAWKTVKEKAAEAWDEMLGVGREDTDADRLAKLQERLKGPSAASAASAYARGGVIGGVRNIAQQIADELSDSQSAIQAEIDEINKRIADGAAKSAEQAAAAKIEAEGVEAIKRVDALGKAAETNAEKRKKALEQLARDIEKIRAATPSDPRLDPANIAKLQANISEQYKDKQPKQREYRDDAAARLLISLQQQQATLAEQLSTEGKLSDAQKERAKFEALIGELKEKKTLTADQKSLLANQDAIRIQLNKNVALAEEIRLREDANRLAAFQVNLQSQNQSAEAAYQLQLAAFGLGREQAAQIQERMRLEQQFAQQQNQLQEQYNRGDISKSLYESETSALSDALSERLALQDDYYRQLEEKQSSSLLGVKSAFANFAEEAGNVAQQTEQMVSGILDSVTSGAGNAFEQMIFDAKSLEEVMGSLAETVLRGVVNALGEMAAKFAINTALELAGINAVTAAKTAQAATVATAQTAAIATTTTAAVGAAGTVAAAQAPAAAATTAAWAPAATVASIGSFGTAAAIGLAAVVAALALSKGFRGGGYTGNGGVNDVAGVVHGREFVFDANATSRIGVNNLEKLRAGRAVAMAGARQWKTPEGADSASSGPAGGITIGQMVFPSVRTEREAAQAGGAAARQINRVVRAGGRYD